MESKTADLDERGVTRRSRPKFDVLVIGAGPAGSATAIPCANAGLSVAILEASSFPRDLPGESLHPGIEILLRQLGVFDRVSQESFLRHRGTQVHWGNTDSFQPFGSDENGGWHGWQIVRSRFDEILLTKARELGAAVFQPLKAESVTLNNNRVVGIDQILARYCIDATGGCHWLARRLDCTITKYSPPLYARYGYVTGDNSPVEESPRIQSDETGWTWLAKVQPSLYQWIRLDVSGKRSSDLPPGEFSGMRPHGKTKGADVTWRMVKESAGPGYFLTGDAAAVLDPASSHGVLHAIASGMMAAHLIVQVLKHGADEVLAAENYRNWITGRFYHDAHRLRELYSIFAPLR